MPRGEGGRLWIDEQTGPRKPSNIHERPSSRGSQNQPEELGVQYMPLRDTLPNRRETAHVLRETEPKTASAGLKSGKTH